MNDNQRPEPMLDQKTIWLVGSLAGIAVFLIIALWYFFMRSEEGLPVSAPVTVSPSPVKIAGADASSMRSHTTRPRSGFSSRRGVALTSKQLPSISRDAQQVLTRLLQLLEAAGAASQFSTEQIAEMAELMDQLAASGEGALPVIRKFLESGRDVDFYKVAGGEQVGYATLRMAIMDMLGQIGGAEAEAVAIDAARNTRSSHELAYLGKMLEEIAPQQYREQIITTALALLVNAGKSDLARQDMTHLFETLQSLGDQRVVPELVKAIPQWNYYPALALAGLPDGAGLPTLVALAKDPKILALGSGDYVLRVLAQVAMQTPTARAALLDQARIGKIPDTAWLSIASALAGYGIQFGNPVFDQSRMSVNWSTTEISQHIAYIDQLIGVTQDPGAVKALREARDVVAAKLAR